MSATLSRRPQPWPCSTCSRRRAWSSVPPRSARPCASGWCAGRTGSPPSATSAGSARCSRSSSSPTGRRRRRRRTSRPRSSRPQPSAGSCSSSPGSTRTASAWCARSSSATRSSTRRSGSGSRPSRLLWRKGADLREDSSPVVGEVIAERYELEELVDAEGRLPVRRALDIAIQVARGLAFAHEHGLVHRDVKLQNVILNGDGRAKVTDFGIARSLEVQGVTQTGTLLGTSNYIAPEQASGEPVDQTTDVYSLGVVLFELLTGEVPFPGESFVAVAMRHVSEPPPNVLDVRPEVPARVAHAVDRALQKDPAARFPTMDAFAAELQACLAALGPRPDADTTLVRQRPVLRESARRVARAGTRRRLLPLALVLVGLALLA